ncbi:MAG: hypothetical protein ACLQQ4_07170 [Bacteroidia bacterium]
MPRQNKIASYLSTYLLFVGIFQYKPANAQLTVGAGTGFSTIQLELSQNLTNWYWSSGFYLFGIPAYLSAPVIKFVSLAYNLSVDYRVYKNSYFSVVSSYQYINDLPCSQVDPTQQLETISRLNIGVRYLYNTHFNKDNDTNKRLELFAGGRIGLSCWRDILPAGTDLKYHYLIYSSLSLVSFQVLFVLRYYPFYFSKIKSDFLKNIGLDIEGGLGTPYYLEGGLVYKFARKKQASPIPSIEGNVEKMSFQTATEFDTLHGSDSIWNYPHTFLNRINIKFSVKNDGPVLIYITDLRGLLIAYVIKNEYYKKGSYSINYNSSGLVLGSYFCVLETNNGKQKCKMLLKL